MDEVPVLGVTRCFPVASPALVFFMILLVVLFTPVVVNGLEVPRVVKVILTNVLINGCKLGVLRQSTSFRLFNGIKLCCVVFLTTLRVSVRNVGGGGSQLVVCNLLAYFIPFFLAFNVDV